MWLRQRCGVTAENREILPFYEGLGWGVTGFVAFEVYFAASENGYQVECERLDVRKTKGPVAGCLALERVVEIDVSGQSDQALAKL